jgi:hypothetical protein
MGKVKKVRVEKRINEIVNRLNKTKVGCRCFLSSHQDERVVDFQTEQEERLAKDRARARFDPQVSFFYYQ